MSDTAPPKRLFDDHVLKITSATIMSAHGAANDAFFFGDETKSRVPR
jgi:hypothetical protein